MAISKRVRFEVFKRDNFTCQYCGQSAPDVVLQVDHFEPRSSGGSDDITNLFTACVPCNQGKSDITITPEHILRQCLAAHMVADAIEAGRLPESLLHDAKKFRDWMFLALLCHDGKTAQESIAILESRAMN